MLKDSYKLFVESAMRIPNFKVGTKEEYNDIQTLADSYLQAEANNDKQMMEAYLSALVVRYWYMIPYLHSKSETLRLEHDDIISWLYLAMIKAFEYRGWVTDKKTSAEKCINRCIDSIRLNAFQEANYDMRKINYITYSLDESIEKFGDSSEGLFVEDNNDNFDVEQLVNTKLTKKDVLSALIIDSICFNDCFSKNNFSVNKLVSGLTSNYVKVFKDRYETSNYINKEIDDLVHSKELKKKVKCKLNNLKNDKEILACFMM